jgi:hypothetical protein
MTEYLKIAAVAIVAVIIAKKVQAMVAPTAGLL